eukprot:7476599-Prorocentrum_lima.AAC.1
MTSSLVGSEMCIRDRLWTWESASRIAPGVAAVVRDVHRQARPAYPTFPPVSYTHLTLPTICSV